MAKSKSIKEQVLKAFRGKKPRDLAHAVAATGAGQSTVSSYIHQLHHEGLLERTGRGLYRAN